MVVTALLLGAGLFLGVYVISAVERRFQGLIVGAPELLGVLTTLMLWIGILSAGLVLGLGVGLLFSAPLLERLSRRVELLARGGAPNESRGLRWELGQALGGALYFLAAAPLVFLLNLVPLVGPLLGLFWGAWALALQQTDSPLTRRGLDFPTRKTWHRTWRPESMGFGLAGLVLLIVPFANLLLAPALSAGATLLVLELEQEQVRQASSARR
jgi:CysZ protein